METAQKWFLSRTVLSENLQLFPRFLEALFCLDRNDYLQHNVTTLKMLSQDSRKTIASKLSLYHNELFNISLVLATASVVEGGRI